MRVSCRSFPVAFAVLLAVSGPGHTAELPDAVYRCQIYSGGMIMHLGDIEISGEQYRGPASDGNFEDWYPVSVTEAGTIDWGGPLGGFSSGGNTVVSSVLTKDGDATAFDVMMQLPSGNFTTVSCIPE